MSDDLVAGGVDIGHVNLRVADLDRSLVFYEGVLGFKVRLRLGDEAAFLAAGGYHHHIALNTWHSRGGSAPAPGSTGLHHVAIRFPSREALTRAARRVDEHGIGFTGANDYGFAQSLYLEDRDGNGIELTWDRPPSEWPRTPEGEPLHQRPRPLDVQATFLS
jgi:catechol 2,3-dioxygenase